MTHDPWRWKHVDSAWAGDIDIAGPFSLHLAAQAKLNMQKIVWTLPPLPITRLGVRCRFRCRLNVDYSRTYCKLGENFTRPNLFAALVMRE